jgi:uncharacterized protein YkwD
VSFSRCCPEKISYAENSCSIRESRTDGKELPLLKWDEGLARAARKHAELMAEQYLVQHHCWARPT